MNNFCTHTDALTEASELYEKGWRVDDENVVYNLYTHEVKNAYEYLQKANTYGYLKKLCEYNDNVQFGKLTDYEAVQGLPVVCYHGKFYKNNKPLTDIQIRVLVHQMYPKFDLQTIERVVKGAIIYKKIDTIPPYQFSKVEPKDNEFRFPKEAYQLLHYLLYEPKQKYILTIMSEGNMGKSTFTNFLRYCFKDEYYSADTKSMNQFSASFYASHRLVVFSDCTSKYIEDSHMLKQISGGDEVQIEAKGQQAYSSTIDSYMLFIGNEPLSYNVLDSGLQNRFVNIPWNNNIPKEKRDTKWLNYKWSEEEIAYQLRLAQGVEPLDFEKLQKETIKVSLRHKPAFYESNFKDFEKKYPNNYGFETYLDFWKLVRKYYTKDEWQKIIDERNALNCDMWKNNQDVEISEICDQKQLELLEEIF